MNFIKIQKIFSKRYMVQFIGPKIELHKFLNIVLQDESVYFNFFEKCWEIREENLDAFMKRYGHLNLLLERNIIKGYDKALDSIGQSMKLKPYIYQREAIKFVLDNNNALLILPCGAGKTPSGIGMYLEAMERGLIKGKGLIVVKASLKTQWVNEVGKFSDLKAIEQLLKKGTV